MAATLHPTLAPAHVFPCPPAPPSESRGKPNTDGWYTRSPSRSNELVLAKAHNGEEPVSCPPFEEEDDE